MIFKPMMLQFYTYKPVRSIMFLFAFVPCAVLSQSSYFWVLDNNTSRIDVGSKGAAAANPPTAIPANKPLVAQGKRELKVSNFFTAGWQGASGNFDIEMEVVPQTDADTWTPGGLMFTGSKENNLGANFVVIVVSPAYGVVFNSMAPGPGNKQINYSVPITLPLTLRLSRVGNSVTGYYKDNPADNWTELGNVSLTQTQITSADVAKMLFENTHVKENNVVAGGVNGE